MVSIKIYDQLDLIARIHVDAENPVDILFDQFISCLSWNEATIYRNSRHIEIDMYPKHLATRHIYKVIIDKVVNYKETADDFGHEIFEPSYVSPKVGNIISPECLKFLPRGSQIKDSNDTRNDPYVWEKSKSHWYLMGHGSKFLEINEIDFKPILLHLGTL